MKTTMETHWEEPFSVLAAPNPESLVPVNVFFKGRDVFITGALGFMGKVLVEKLLWECQDIGNLYLLVRPKKETSGSKRLEDMFNLPIFDRIKARDPSILSKVLPISGDLLDFDLGISPLDRKLLEERVSVVFHVASTVRFDEPIKRAILLNVRGTRDIVNLSKNMKNIKAMVYVSTSYSNTAKSVIQEKVLKADMDWRAMIKSAEVIDDHLLNIMTRKLVGSHPNTYTFSKHLAESVVYEHRNEIPTIIYRPSIVSFSAAEPIPGWVDNLNGPIGLSLGIITGVLHVLHGKGTASSDFMPCDFAISGLIVTAWYRGIMNNHECLAINAACGEKKKLSTDVLYEMVKKIICRAPSMNTMWYPSFITTSNRAIYLILVWFTHLLPAILIDIVLRMKGIKFRLLILYRRIFIANDALYYFIKNEWTIETQKFDTLKTFLVPMDKLFFTFDMNMLDEVAAVARGIGGVKKYILKEDMSESALRNAQKRIQRLYWVAKTLKILFIGSMFWILYRQLQKYNILAE